MTASYALEINPDNWTRAGGSEIIRLKATTQTDAIREAETIYGAREDDFDGLLFGIDYDRDLLLGLSISVGAFKTEGSVKSFTESNIFRVVVGHFGEDGLESTSVLHVAETAEAAADWIIEQIKAGDRQAVTYWVEKVARPTDERGETMPFDPRIIRAVREMV